MATIASSVKALNAYLRHSKTCFMKHHVTRTADGVATKRLLHVVMGNEALDLDSTVSSVLLANLYHHYYMDVQESLASQVAAVDVLPLLPIDRRDFVLRQDADALLRRVGVDLQHLVFLDDLSGSPTSVKQALLNCQQAGQLRLTITDHNLLGHDFKDLAPSVVGIVDHHVDQSDPLHANLSQEKEIVVVGSATTLVAERYLAVTPLPRLTPKHEFDPTTLIDASISNLLLGTILIDTVNMKPSMARGTPRDQAAIDAIVKSVLASGDQFGLASVGERTELFEYLQAVKFDLSRLTSAELLRKDYKSWFAYKKYGISSVTRSTAEWVSKDPEMATSFASYIKEQDIAFLIILTSFTDPEFKREVMALAAPGSEALLDHVLSAVMETLTLSAVPTPSSLSPSGSQIKFFSQADIKLSRKQVQPAIHDALLSYESRL